MYKLNIWKKILELFCIKNNNSKNNLSIEFLFEKNTKDIKVNLILPTDEEISLSNITELSEKFAELLVGIDYGLFREQIFKNLSNIQKESREENTILFVENVISFYNILKKELINKSIFYQRPIIPPSMVFKIHSNDKY